MVIIYGYKMLGIVREQVRIVTEAGNAESVMRRLDNEGYRKVRMVPR